MGAAPLLGITLFLSLSSLSLPILSSFAPTTSFFLSCGSTSTITLSADNPARNFTPDSKFLLSTSDSIPLANPETPSSPLYAAARAFTASSTYRFSVGSHGTHVLRLHFLPFFARGHNLSAAHFTVSAPQGVVLLRDFSVAAAAGPVVEEFFVSVDSDQLLLTFDPADDDLAFVNAVELFTAPSNLLNGSDPRDVVRSGETIADLFPMRPMGTVYRINVGGPLVTPANDTLWRTWSLDVEYLHTPLLALTNSTGLRNVKYETDPQFTPEIAPASVYSTARTMNVPLDMRQGNPGFNFNVTWQFRVVAGGEYFVRMHFCDFVSPTATDLFFDVYLGSLMAYPDLQPGSFTDQTPAAAFFVDFAVHADSDVLNVSIGRSSKSTPLTANAILNGLEIMRLINLGSTSSAGSNKKISTPVLIVLILGGLILIAALIIVLIFVCKRCRRSKPVSESKGTNSIPSSPFRGSANSVSLADKSTSGTTPGTTPRTNLGLQISFAEIKLATEDFNDKNLIGSGGFGKVYKGVLMDGTRVAVKRGQPQSKQGYPEFQTEILLLSRIRHRHLVSLIGYCEEQSEMLLVYEFMEKGTLKSHLYGTDLPCLSWKQRLQICIGAARGLHYLHTGDAQSIIHRDVKSSNILLGEDYVAKVSDFGLSKVGPSYGESHVSTAVKGSFGYLDPEYFKTQKLTDKSDVYSFGVVLLEVLCARPVIDPLLSREQISLSEWALSWLRRGQLDKIIDQRLAGKINANSLRKFGETADRCLAEYSSERPGIGDVLWNLEYALHLQETELHREPYEDSGNIESQILVAAVRRAPSTSLGIGEEEERGSEGQSDVTESKVFSQLVTGEGR